MQSIILITTCRGYILSISLIIADNLGLMTEEVFVRFLHCKVTPFPPFLTALWKSYFQVIHSLRSPSLGKIN